MDKDWNGNGLLLRHKQIILREGLCDTRGIHIRETRKMEI